MYRLLSASTALALASGVALLAASAPTAQAAARTATASVDSGNIVQYAAAPGQVNHVWISTKYIGVDPGDNSYTVTVKDRVDITAGRYCAYPDPGDHRVVTCTSPGHGDSYDGDAFQVLLGDRNDTLAVDPASSLSSAIAGGSGNDTIWGTGYDVLYGQGGNDRLNGGGGIWGLGSFGGAGNDLLSGCSSVCHGGSGNDTLYGTDRQANALYGDDGNDTVYGRSGADTLYGGKGNDRLYGEHGNDRLYGNSGNDVLHGGQGSDTLSGGPGRDKLYQN
ncbi:calcium-binding protein [Streptomyces sp. NBC_01262]|uniref:calcium-binding protein n=1 Tax=Streptomyces sp. NBC_01262 TaxID=2903803 RepID=UPI002E3284D6|nr:calcium-binding protein [Streptomyces sp. NBC_01262]